TAIGWWTRAPLVKNLLRRPVNSDNGRFSYGALVHQPIAVVHAEGAPVPHMLSTVEDDQIVRLVDVHGGHLAKEGGAHRPYSGAVSWSSQLHRSIRIR